MCLNIDSLQFYRVLGQKYIASYNRTLDIRRIPGICGWFFLLQQRNPKKKPCGGKWRPADIQMALKWTLEQKKTALKPLAWTEGKWSDDNKYPEK